MLESILNFREVDRSPYLTFLWSFLITNVAIILSTQISYTVRVGSSTFNLGGLFAVLFTIIPSVYFITVIIKKEEKMEEDAIKAHYSKGFWGRHEKDLIMFLFFFLGVTFAFSLWAFFLKPNFFHVQMTEIQRVRAAISGQAVMKGSIESFIGVTMNNLNVLVFSFVFSILFGAGMVFILVWNASILGVYVGELSKSIYEIPLVTMQFLPHGIPEVVGYLCAGLSGGLLSAAILRSHKLEVLSKIFVDSMIILVVGVLFVLLGAVIEVYF